MYDERDIDQHVRFMHMTIIDWMIYFFRAGTRDSTTGDYTISRDLAAQWERKMQTSYDALTEEAKVSLRDDVICIMKRMESERLDRIMTWQPSQFVDGPQYDHQSEAWKRQQTHAESFLVVENLDSKEALCRAFTHHHAVWIASRLNLLAQHERVGHTYGTCKDCQHWIVGPTASWPELDEDLPYCHEIRHWAGLDHPIHTVANFGCSKFHHRVITLDEWIHSPGLKDGRQAQSLDEILCPHE